MKYFLRMCVLLVETGVATTVITVLTLHETWLWELTKGGNQIALLVPPVVVLAFWLAVWEKKRSIKWFSIAFHSLYIALVLAGLIVYWMEPFPD